MVLFLRICWKKLFQHHITQISTGLHQFSSITLSNFKLVFFNFFNQDSSLSAYFFKMGKYTWMVQPGAWIRMAIFQSRLTNNATKTIIIYLLMGPNKHRFGLCHWLTQPLCQGRARLRLFLIIKINKIMLQAYFGFKW